MGLKTDIEKAVLKSLGNPEDKGRVPEFAKDLSDAIIKFIQAQDFQITEMKSRIEIEHIGTTNDIPANIPVKTQVVTDKPIISFLNKLQKALAAVPQTSAAVTPLAIDLGKLKSTIDKQASIVENGGVEVPFSLDNKGNNDAGELISTAYAYIGNRAPKGQTNEGLTKVNLSSVKTGTE